MADEGVYVAALGASTPVGRDAWSSAAAVRAGISGFVEHPYMIDTAGEPMRVALAPWLDVDMPMAARLEALLLPAIETAMQPLLADRGRFTVGLALGLPAPRPGLPDSLDAHFRAVVKARYGERFARVATFPVGHAAGALALDAAMTKLTAPTFDACIVAGVDSYLVPETLEWLEANEQLHGAGPLNNAWGFIPGEGAGAVLLLREGAVTPLRADAFAQVLSVGRGTEPNRIKTETVCIGEGLTDAFRAGLGGLPAGTQVTDVYCDMNGEPYRGDEFGFAALRTKEAFVSASDFVAPADCWGDVSAATVPLGMCLSAIAGAKHYSNGAYAFLWASSEGGERGSALLHTRAPQVG
jgi:3-oxoacyl-[acyl-carrier-protein] synthase-1